MVVILSVCLDVSRYLWPECRSGGRRVARKASRVGTEKIDDAVEMDPRLRTRALGSSRSLSEIGGRVRREARHAFVVSQHDAVDQPIDCAVGIGLRQLSNQAIASLAISADVHAPALEQKSGLLLQGACAI